MEGMITWHSISTGNLVINLNWKELTIWYEQKPDGVVESENLKIYITLIQSSSKRFTKYR